MASSAFDLYHQDVYQFIELERLHGSMKGQNVLVTGAGRGIGRAISLAFAKVGANVACLARTEVEIAAVAHEIHSLYNVTTTYRVADVTDNEKLTCAVMSLSDELGSIDILVNNAGITRLSPFEFEDMSTWWSVLETNLRAPVVLTHLLLPSMISRGSGTIISIGSRCAANNMPFSTAYSAAKTALLRFHQCLDLELHGKGICNYVVEPGDVPTTITHETGAIASDAIVKDPAFRKMLEGTVGTCTEAPELAAHTCVVLAADPRAASLSGMYIDACQDLEQLIEDLERGATSEIRQRRLLQLKVEVP